MNNYIRMGSVSWGTLRNEDLIPRFVDRLRRLQQEANVPALPCIEAGFTEYKAGKMDADEQSEFLIELMDALDAFAPPYFYFGSNEGDGSDFGFWLRPDWEQEFDGLRVDDTAKVPADYTGEVLHVSDHGNPTLYSAQDGKLTEVWAIV